MTLLADQLTVRFGGVRAVNDVSIEVQPGRVTAVVGPNGAGKTTLFNCLTGFVTPERGRVVLDEDDISALAPHIRARRGLSRTFQTPRVDLEDTGLAAVALGYCARYHPSLVGSLLGLPTVRRRERDIELQARASLERVGLARHADRRIAELSLGQLRLLEVARATVADPRKLLLDEPAAGLGMDDRRRLAETLHEVCAAGMGVMLIEHNLGFVTSVSHSVWVMHQGSVIFTGTPEGFRKSPAVRAAYIGGSAPGLVEGAS